jgi:peptidoglycan/xylan/chitin deacetylase (PgdA/CDA1 family)
MYLVRTPKAVKSLAPFLRWNFPRDRAEIYLTFDDGPTPEITYEILDILDAHDAKASFFCIGGNVNRNPEVYAEILRRGHLTGNHTWNHMDGWKFSDFSYFRNILECSTLVHSRYFRPPYGKIRRSQAKSLRQRFEIVMWDVLSGDWDANVTPEKCFANATKDVKGGSIIVFHDSDKAYQNMIYALPRALDHWKKEGFKVRALPA